MGNESPTEGRAKRIGRAERPTAGRERSPPVIPLSRSPTEREGATAGSGQRAWGRGDPHAKEGAGGDPRPTPAQDGHGAKPRRHEETRTHVQAAARQQTKPDERTSRSGSDDTDPRRGAQGGTSATQRRGSGDHREPVPRSEGAGGTRAPRRLPDRREGMPRRFVGNFMEPVGHKTMPVSRSVTKADGTPLTRTPKGLRAYGLNAKGEQRRLRPVALRP